MVNQNLETNDIFECLNLLKHYIGLAVSDFLENTIGRDIAIKRMESRFNDIVDTVKNYYTKKSKL